MRLHLTILLIPFIFATSTSGQYNDPDNTSKEQFRMIRLKLKNKADSVRSMLKELPENSEKRLLILAEQEIDNNAYHNAALIVNRLLEENPANDQALLLKGKLEIAGWRLENALGCAKEILDRHPAHPAALLLKGKVLILQKNYTSALTIAKDLQQKFPENAAAYLLEADACFWNQQPDKVEGPLKRSLQLDPLNADARFSYGYAIWRRGDAMQLNAMAAQWDLALAIDSLHYQTHWHFGNGHTNLTYADYARPDDSAVRANFMLLTNTCDAI